MDRIALPRFTRRLATVLVLLVVLTAAVTSQASTLLSAQYDQASAPSVIIHDASVTHQAAAPVAPGVQMITFHRHDERGPVQGYVLAVDLANPAISFNLLSPGPLAAAEPLSTMAARSGAVAAINGDFFDMHHTNAPYGVAVANGELLKGPIYSWTRAAGVGVDRVGRLAEMALDGVVALPSGEYPLVALNQHNIVEGGIGLYTTVWGSAPRGRAVEGVEPVREVLVLNGTVAEIGYGPGTGWIPPEGFVLLGRDAGAEVLAQLQVGDPVSVRYGPRTDAPVPFGFALGGKEVLLRHGQVQHLDNGKSEPRTAIGFSADGQRMFLLTVDGRRHDTRGLTLHELAVLLQSMGAHDALNLDGGGSTTMLARKPGEWGAVLSNRPSGGAERAVPNGIGIFVAPGSGQLAGMRVLPVLAEWENRVFPGLSRTLIARGFDEHYGPATAADVAWQSLTPEYGGIGMDGVFRGGVPGTALVQAYAPGIDGTRSSEPYAMQVLGPLERIEAHTAGLELLPGAGPGYFSVVGHGADGARAQIEPRDVALAYDPAILEIVVVDHKHFQVTEKLPLPTLITAYVGQAATTFLANGIVINLLLSEFEQVEQWYASAWQGTSSLAHVSGLNGQGIQLVYDFSQTAEPRVASVQPTAPIALPDQPLKLGLWVWGEERGERLVFALRDAAGQPVDVQGPTINWSGWRLVEADVPQGLTYPLHLHAISIVEDNPGKQYTGQIGIDGLSVTTIQGTK